MVTPSASTSSSTGIRMNASAARRGPGLDEVTGTLWRAPRSPARARSVFAAVRQAAKLEPHAVDAVDEQADPGAEEEADQAQHVGAEAGHREVQGDEGG